MPEYVTVYQISKQSPDWVLSWVGVLPFIVSVVIIVGKRWFRWRRPNWFVPIFLALFGFVLFYVTPSLNEDSEALSAFQSGHYSLVEGVVTDFHPMPYEGHDEECFSVGSQRFCYSDYIVTPGFHNAASHGGPIRAGLHVRIAYSFPTILRLDVAKDETLTPAESRAAAESARRQWEITTENDPIQQRMTIAFRFTAVCLTLWWNLQWKRAMRFWLRPPNQPITQYIFRIFFGLSLIGALSGLVQQLRLHPLTRENSGATLAMAAIMCCVVGSMTALMLWRSERRDRQKV